MDIVQYREHVVRYTLMSLGLYSPEVEVLVLGTAVHESLGLRYIRQLGNGPAMGFVQMEGATHDDIWKNFLRYRSTLTAKIINVCNLPDSALTAPPMSTNLITNMAYGVAMCRVHYLRQPGAIPRTLEGQAVYWKKYYNTHLGKGTEEEYIHNWREYIAPTI